MSMQKFEKTTWNAIRYAFIGLVIGLLVAGYTPELWLKAIVIAGFTLVMLGVALSQPQYSRLLDKERELEHTLGFHFLFLDAEKLQSVVNMKLQQKAIAVDIKAREYKLFRDNGMSILYSTEPSFEKDEEQIQQFERWCREYKLQVKRAEDEFLRFYDSAQTSKHKSGITLKQGRNYKLYLPATHEECVQLETV